MVPLLFNQDLIFYLSIAVVAGVHWFLFRSRAGLKLRSVGDSHASAHALGINVIRTRYLAVMFGGACAGLAGAQLSLVYTPQWVENMSAGRGWIALALVVFASWRPWRVVAGGYLFGAVSISQLHAQAFGIGIPVAVSFCSSLSGDDCRTNSHLAQSAHDTDQHAGIARQAVCAGPVTRTTTQNAKTYRGYNEKNSLRTRNHGGRSRLFRRGKRTGKGEGLLRLCRFQDRWRLDAGA